jgi:AcrR family transcriptional regulator
MARPRTDIAPRILTAARARFLAEGVDGASLRDIAKDAKTSIGMIFYYFPTKDDLFQAVIEEVYAGLVRDLEATLGRGGTARARLERASARVGNASREELDVVRLIVHEALLGSARFERTFARFQTGHIALIVAVLGEGARDGEIDPSLPLPLLLVATLGMLALPQVVRRVAGSRPIFAMLPEAEPLAQLLSGLLFTGIGAKRLKRAKSAKSAKA